MASPTKDRKPQLRNLQFSPIKEQDEQYIVLWDPSGLTAEKLIIPVHYFYLLQFFDGEHTLEQIGGEYLRRFGEFLLPDRLERLVDDMEAKLFLEGDKVEQARRVAMAEFRSAPLRAAAFSGKSYEADGQKLTTQLDGFFSSEEGPGFKSSTHAGQPIRALVAPHYDLRQGGPIYAWAYKELQEAVVPDLFVIVGTCHAGLKNLFAVTEKDFETPLGVVPVDRELVARFRQKAGNLFFEEELAHRTEHSIEFQLPFLQFTTQRRPADAGAVRPVTILPILCAFPVAGVTDPHLQPMRAQIEAFLGMLHDTLAETGRQACFVASADLAHIGLRYGDPSPPSDFAFHKCMQTDLAMLKHVEDLNPEALAAFIRQEDDRRRICGFSPLYSVLKLLKDDAPCTGEVLRYDRGITDQFNSTVTYASMAFF
jgi:AmmeMemoRadiSam system protein B